MFTRPYLASELPVTDSTTRRPAAWYAAARPHQGSWRRRPGPPAGNPSPQPQPPGAASAMNRAAAASIQPGKGNPPWPP
jgi:hypothetical protein